MECCFSPFRVVGSICSEVSVSAATLYGEPVLMVATGKTFQLFRGKALSMLRGGPSFEHHVRAVAQAGKYRMAAEGSRIHAFSHHKPLWTIEHNATLRSTVTHLLAADDLLFSAGKDQRIAIWNIRTGDLLREILVEKSETVAALLLPSGYTNKLLVATEEGTLHLYNFKSGECLWYSSREQEQRTSGGMTSAAIMCLATSAYKDIIAYGTSDGRVVVLDFGRDEVLVTFTHKDAAVTALVFRTDKDGLLVSGTSLGEIAVWNLETRSLDGVLTRSREVRSYADALDQPHTELVHSLLMLPGEATLVSAGADNALMQFRFDTVDQLGLLVRERRGHMGPCTTAQFYNSDLLVTAGDDRALRVTHVFSDRASWELSQGKLGRRGRQALAGREAMKLTPATHLASRTTRNYQWSSVVAVHEASSMISGWRMDTRCLDIKVSAISTTMHSARCVAVSDCGNFAVVGYSSGNVAAINLQNKSIRHFLASKSASTAHEGSVECVEVACSNSIVVTAGLDEAIMVWGLQSRELRMKIRTPAPCSHSCIHQPSSLFIAAQHMTIRVYNCHPDLAVTEAEGDHQEPLRVFDGHNGPITALALAPDVNRYVVSASGDGAVLVWDLAAASCVGQYRVASPMISVSFHPDALFMVTTHAGERGAFLWTNNLRYGFAPELIADPKDRPTESLPWLHYPTGHGEAEDDAEEGFVENPASVASAGAPKARDVENCDDEPRDGATGGADVEADAQLFDASKDIALRRREQMRAHRAMLDTIPTEGLGLAGVPRSTWFNLTVLDQIKEKNQPILPPKKRDVPFFLPTTQDLRPTFIVALGGTDEKHGAEASGGAVARPSTLDFWTEVQRQLLRGEYDTVMAQFAASDAPSIDLELKRVVNYVDGATYTPDEVAQMRESLIALFKFFAHWLRTRKNVELVQGLLANVTVSHGSLITKLGREMVPILQEVAVLQNEARYELEHLLGYPACLVSSFTRTLM